MTPELLRAYVVIIMRDILIPGGGLFLAIYLPLTGQLANWHLPLVAGMLGVPLVAPRGNNHRKRNDGPKRDGGPKDHREPQG